MTVMEKLDGSSRIKYNDRLLTVTWSTVATVTALMKWVLPLNKGSLFLTVGEMTDYCSAVSGFYFCFYYLDCGRENNRTGQFYFFSREMLAYF